MDPYGSEGELVNIHNAFIQSQYQTVVDFDTSPFTAENQKQALVLQYRARLALKDFEAVQEDLKSEASSTEIDAVKIFAKHQYFLQRTSNNPSQSQEQLETEQEKIVAEASDLAEKSSDDLTVQLLCGIVLASASEFEKAVTLLSKHQGSLDAIALLCQIHLMQNRIDLAEQEIRKARTFAQDDLLVNIAESWVGLRKGGDKYQAAFYVYEELATAPSSTSTNAILGQSIAELHLGRLPEAEAALTRILAESPDDPDIIANAIVLNTVAGKVKEAAELKAKLEEVAPGHVLATDLQKKRALFESARAKYQPKFEVEGAA